MRIAIATFTGMPPEFRDDELLLDSLTDDADRGAVVAYHAWDQPGVDWESFDLVFARSPWDYSQRLAEFLRWVRRLGPRLENAAPLIEWNSDKRYLRDLAGQGLPVVETAYVGPSDPVPPIDRELVIKPAVSAGARDSGRFSAASAAQALALLERITARGGIAMVQPFVDSVEALGETAVVTIAGEVSHVLRKGAVLAADQVAPVRDDELGAAEAMYDPGLVVPGAAAPDELELVARVLAEVRGRFETTPLVARIDMVRGSDGEPLLIELEAIEPNLYFEHAPAAAQRLARAILDRAGARARGDRSAA